ncbi:tetratricopeptide repeat protein [Zavarzinella formosa]|uniref:tetratricopeptide repeat protein n=1 Tax=Zavarzinella formosa TaxID=360055 RepID=UPI0002D8B889|nr:hypothetical protein [Zavarzinella formosa]
MAKKSIVTSGLVFKLEKALSKNRMKEAVDTVFKLAELTPAEMPSETLRGHFFKVLEAVQNQELKPLVRQLLQKIAADIGLTPEQNRKLGEGWLKIGEEQKAFELAQRVNDADLLKTIQLRATDRAVIDPKSSSASLLNPAQLAEIAALREAFAAHEAGNAELAREKLNAIGMASPLMEWKLMLRGLIAWAAKEDTKVAENWSRLKPDRLPAKLVAPLRSFVEPVVSTQLSGIELASQEKQTAILLGPLMGNLAKIRTLVGQERNREPLFRAAKEITGELRMLSKRALNTLGSVVYWSIYLHGQPPELGLYEQAFGKPELDPKFHRLRGLVAERLHELDMAHEEWSEYERWILRNPQFFPVTHINRIRGTLQLRIARLAIDLKTLPEFPDDLFSMFGRGVPPKPKGAPSPEPALRSAMELMPDDKEPVLELFDFLMENEREADAKAIVDLLEKKFGEDMEALRRLEAYYLDSGDFEKSIACLRKSIALNPLDKRLRMRGAIMGLTLARSCASKGDYDQARRCLDEVRPNNDDSVEIFNPSILALRGVMAAKEKNKEVWEAIKTDLTKEQNRVPGVYLLLAEGNRVKLPKKELDGFLAEFKAILAKPPSMREFELLIKSISQYQLDPVPYRGLASHEKLLQAAVIAATANKPTESDLQIFGIIVLGARWAKTLKEIARIGTRQYPKNAYFWFFQAEAIQGPKNPPVINRQAQMPYVRAHDLMEEKSSIDYTLLRKFWEKRLAETPDLQALMDEQVGGGYYKFF